MSIDWNAYHGIDAAGEVGEIYAGDVEHKLAAAVEFIEEVASYSGCDSHEVRILAADAETTLGLIRGEG